MELINLEFKVDIIVEILFFEFLEDFFFYFVKVIRV